MVLKIVLWAFLIGSLILGYFGMQAAGVTTTLIGIGVLFVLVFLVYFLFQLGFEAFLVFLKFFGIAILVGILILLTIRGCNMVIAKGKQATQVVMQKTDEITEKMKENAASESAVPTSDASESWFARVKSFVIGREMHDVSPSFPEMQKTPSAPAVAPKTAKLSGFVSHVYSGNIFKIGNNFLKLYGVDVPNIKQTCIDKRGETYNCGQIAKQRLEKLLLNKNIVCQTVSHYAQNQYVVTCALKGYDVGATMVAVGWAVADRHVTDAYVPYENEAHSKRLGLWAGKFVAPWVYRRQAAISAQSEQKSGFFQGLFK